MFLVTCCLCPSSLFPAEQGLGSLNKGLRWELTDSEEIFPEENRATLRSRVFPSRLWGLDTENSSPSFSPEELVDAENGTLFL